MSDTQGEHTRLFRCQEHGRLLGRVRKKPKGHRLQYERASKEHQQVVYTTSHCMSVFGLSSSGYIHIARADCLCRPDRHDNTASVQSFRSYKPRCMQQVEAAQSKSEKPMSCTQSRISSASPSIPFCTSLRHQHHRTLSRVCILRAYPQIEVVGKENFLLMQLACC